VTGAAGPPAGPRSGRCRARGAGGQRLCQIVEGWLLLEDGVSFPVGSSPHAAFRRTTLACLAAAQRRPGVDGRGEWARRYPAQLVEADLVDCGTAGDR
jgi:hypothetical protein